MKYGFKVEKRRMLAQWIFVILLLLLCVVAAIDGKRPRGKDSETNKYLTSEKNKKSFQEIVAELTSLGLSEVTDEQIKIAEDSWSNIPEEFRDNMEKLPMLLSMIGSGKFDYDTWEWTPTSDCIYSFDMEVFDCSNIYTNFLNGVQAISNQEFTISEVVETVSEDDFERGTGTQTIQFKYNGTSYRYDAKLDFDWFDIKMINFINYVFEK